MSVRRRASGRAHYNYFRDYDPAVGRYVESDPIGLRGGINTFGYVGDNPLSRVDRRGLEYGAAYSTIVKHDRVEFYGPGKRQKCGQFDLFGEIGGQASFHLVFFGLGVSVGAPFTSGGQLCAVVTVCARVGQGLYAGAGGYVTVGGVQRNANNLGGGDIGMGFDVGGGASAGGQVLAGNPGDGTSTPSSVSAAKGKGGVGIGASLGVDGCYSWVKCTKKDECCQ